jgi:hypothetical protein
VIIPETAESFPARLHPNYEAAADCDANSSPLRLPSQTARFDAELERRASKKLMHLAEQLGT